METGTNLDAIAAQLTRAGQHELLARVAVLIVMSWPLTGIASADQQSHVSFQVPRSDLANADALGNQLTALSPRVNRDEANLLAQCAYATVSQLRRQYRMFGTPIFNNFLVYHGIKKRGYCYHWAEDLLLALDKLQLKTLELHWAEAHAGTWRENNCLVVTAKGQPLNRGIMLECWQHLGHLRWNPVLSDQDPYVENAAYARFVRAEAAQKTVGVNHPVAFQTARKANKKSDD